MVIHSATALPAPPAWVIQIASATQKPRTSGDGPISGMPSGVNEKMPLMPWVSGAPRRAGSSSTASAWAASKCSGVNSLSAGGGAFSSKPESSPGRTGSGSCW